MYVVVVKSEELEIQRGYRFEKSKEAIEKVKDIYDDMWEFTNKYKRRQDRCGECGKFEASIRSKDVNVFIFSVEID